MRGGLFIVLAVVWVFLVAGCECAGPYGSGGGDGGGGYAGGGDGARVEHLLYYEWLGTSPGAGFTRTDLVAVEIDLTNGRRRRVHLTANHPEPMIEMPGEERPAVLARARWEALSAEEDEAIRSALRSWLEARPHETSDHARSVGRESGYILRFTLRTAERVYRVRVNPPPDDAVPMTEDRAYPAFLKVKSALTGDGLVG